MLAQLGNKNGQKPGMSGQAVQRPDWRIEEQAGTAERDPRVAASLSPAETHVSKPVFISQGS